MQQLQKSMTDGEYLTAPKWNQGAPTVVTIQLFLYNFDSVSEVEQEYRVDIFLRQFWVDRRLRDDNSKFPTFELIPNEMEKIWVPPIFFYNEKEAHLHMVTVPNKLMHISPKGIVKYSIRVSLVLKCHMNLRCFPFDNQVCFAKFGSYSQTKEQLILHWHKQSPILKRRVKLPYFKLGDIKTANCKDQYGDFGNFSCLRVEFHLQRLYYYYLLHTYVPSFLILVLSWTSFWLDTDDALPRITIGLFTVLTMAIIAGNVQQQLPKIFYIKAIDVWSIMCFIFVFAALFQYFLVNISNRGEKKALLAALKYPQLDESWTDEDGRFTDLGFLKKTMSTIQVGARGQQIDMVSRIFFPVAFVVCNSIYWVVFLMWRPQGEFMY